MTSKDQRKVNEHFWAYGLIDVACLLQFAVLIIGSVFFIVNLAGININFLIVQSVVPHLLLQAQGALKVLILAWFVLYTLAIYGYYKLKTWGVYLYIWLGIISFIFRQQGIFVGLSPDVFRYSLQEFLWYTLMVFLGARYILTRSAGA